MDEALDAETCLEMDNELFQALREHKQREQERQFAVMRDSRSVAETMSKKQRDADENSSVVTASASYASNKNYVRINSGKDPRILLRRGIHPLNPDECDVYTTLVDEAQEARIAAMSNHHVTADGEIEGFRFTCSGTSMARSLPISRKMFFAYSMVECTQCTDGHKGGLGQSILGLLMKQNSVKKSLQRLVGSIHAESVGSEASFECMPEDVDVVENDPRAMYTGRAAADCREWKPEIPEFVGLYHAYVKGFNKETRAHRLFLITSGGCSSMCDNYFNLSVDVRNDMSCQEVLDSEETWFLRKACQRNNARLLARVAAEFDLQIPMISDPYSYEPCSIASCTTETVQYDMLQEGGGQVSVLNRCMDTMSCKNGILCGMHPSEGVWLFKGPVQTNSSMTLYGGPFGGRGSTFPVSTNRNHANYSWRSKPVQDSLVCRGAPCFVASRDGSAVCRVDNQGQPVGSCDGERYTYIDEAYLAMLQEDSAWARDNGIIELMPIAVVAQQQ